MEIALPAVLSVAERLCDPCKVDPAGRAAVPPARLTRMDAGQLGPGPWGEAGSPTVVGATRAMEHERARRVLEGPVAAQVEEAVRELGRRGALTAGPAPRGRGRGPRCGRGPAPAPPPPGTDRTAGRSPSRVIAVLAEPGRPALSEELLGAAARLASETGATVHALCPGPASDVRRPLAAAGADVVVVLDGSPVAEDVADAVAAFVRETAPWAVLAPSTAFGREVAGRAAAATGSGLVGDAIALSVGDGALVAAKPAFAGALVADITCRSATQMVTVRPGRPARPGAPGRRGPGGDAGGQPRGDGSGCCPSGGTTTWRRWPGREVVIGVGTGVTPEEYEQLSPLAAELGAELAATRKVTDRGWAPRARQVGITGRSIAPRLYVAIGLSGKFNHMVGVRAAGTILAVNADRDAPVFEHCDVGIVGDWHEVVPLLHAELRRVLVARAAAAVS